MPEHCTNVSVCVSQHWNLETYLTRTRTKADGRQQVLNAPPYLTCSCIFATRLHMHACMQGTRTSRFYLTYVLFWSSCDLELKPYFDTTSLTLCYSALRNQNWRRKKMVSPVPSSLEREREITPYYSKMNGTVKIKWQLQFEGVISNESLEDK
jgi:hypothetical protein